MDADSSSDTSAALDFALSRLELDYQQTLAASRPKPPVDDAEDDDEDRGDAQEMGYAQLGALSDDEDMDEGGEEGAGEEEHSVELEAEAGALVEAATSGRDAPPPPQHAPVDSSADGGSAPADADGWTADFGSTDAADAEEELPQPPPHPPPRAQAARSVDPLPEERVEVRSSLPWPYP